jgi:hypothetical protein
MNISVLVTIIGVYLICIGNIEHVETTSTELDNHEEEWYVETLFSIDTYRAHRRMKWEIMTLKLEYRKIKEEYHKIQRQVNECCNV